MTELAAKRVEDDVVVQFKVPTTNTDSSAPADLDRIDIYAHTGPLPAAADFVKYGTLVQSVEIKRPEVRKPEDENKPESKTQDPAPARKKPEGTEKPAATPADTPTGVKPYTPELGTPSPPEAGSPEPVEQGWLTSIRETLTAKHRELGPLPPTRAAVTPVAAAAVKVETLETPGTENFEMPVARYYTVVGVSRSRHRRGPFAGPIRVPLIEPLRPPGEVETAYTESAISLTWPGQPGDAPIPPAATGASAATAQGSPAPSAPDSSQSTAAGSPTTQPAPTPPVPDHPAAPDVVAAHLAPAADPNQETPGTFEIYTDVETEGTQDAPRPGAAPTSKPQPPPVPRFGYNVYDAATLVEAADAPQPPPQKPSSKRTAKAVPPVLPLNTRLLTTPTFDDSRVQFGAERCYVVRRVEMAGAVAVESAPSPPACVTPVDKFPPAAPKAVTSVASGTAVSLIWDANAETDLAGYLVLRGEAPGDTLAPLTQSPITDTSYVDTSVRRNRTYVYEVIAVDKTGNQSAASNRVEEPVR